jgi:hypothetical protein
LTGVVAIARVWKTPSFSIRRGFRKVPYRAGFHAGGGSIGSAVILSMYSIPGLASSFSPLTFG